MTDKRFMIPDVDMDSDITLIDTVTGKEYTDNFEDIVDLLNKQDKEILRLGSLKYRYRQNVISYVNALNEEYEKADGELKEALGRVMKTKYEVI